MRVERHDRTHMEQLELRLRAEKAALRAREARRLLVERAIKRYTILSLLFRLIGKFLACTKKFVTGLFHTVVIAFLLAFVLCGMMLGARACVLFIATVVSTVLETVGMIWDDILVPVRAVIGAYDGFISFLHSICILGWCPFRGIALVSESVLNELEFPQPAGTNSFWNFYWAITTLNEICAEYATPAAVLLFFVQLAFSQTKLCGFVRFFYPTSTLGPPIYAMFGPLCFNPVPGQGSCTAPPNGLFCAILGIGFLGGWTTFLVIVGAWALITYRPFIEEVLLLLYVMVSRPLLLVVAAYAPVFDRAAHEAIARDTALRARETEAVKTAADDTRTRARERFTSLARRPFFFS